MNSHTKKLLFDVLEAGKSIQSHCTERTFVEYESDRWFRRAVEREFEVIGEALSRLSRTDSATAQQITELPRIVSFRNRIIHGYDTVDDAMVWGVVESYLPVLVTQIEMMLKSSDGV